LNNSKSRQKGQGRMRQKDFLPKKIFLFFSAKAILVVWHFFLFVY